jgi:hypothetical protein
MDAINWIQVSVGLLRAEHLEQSLESPTTSSIAVHSQLGNAWISNQFLRRWKSSRIWNAKVILAHGGNNQRVLESVHWQPGFRIAAIRILQKLSASRRGYIAKIAVILNRLSCATLSNRDPESHRESCLRFRPQNRRFATCSPDRPSGRTSPQKGAGSHCVALGSCEKNCCSAAGTL